MPAPAPSSHRHTSTSPLAPHLLLAAARRMPNTTMAATEQMPNSSSTHSALKYAMSPRYGQVGKLRAHGVCVQRVYEWWVGRMGTACWDGCFTSCCRQMPSHSFIEASLAPTQAGRRYRSHG